LDLSGSLQGAGGVGGLLAVTTVSPADPQPVIHFPMFDANGNVTEYVSTNGIVAARYAYDAFGSTTAQSGDMADAFTHRFSTKPFDAETGLVMYQLRPYEPGLGRWLTRDPIEEQGGAGLYGFVGNNSAGRWDYLGQSWIEVLAWFGEWWLGIGEPFKTFGPSSNAANDMKNAPGVNAARKNFQSKNSKVKCCKDLINYTNHAARFGVKGLIMSGFNSTRQFIGSYRVDILVSGCTKAKKCEVDFELTNTTSYESYLYGIGPEWERDTFRPMGNVRQTIWWTEDYNAVCP
jgi:RHS repeat-associated protein